MSMHEKIIISLPFQKLLICGITCMTHRTYLICMALKKTNSNKLVNITIQDSNVIFKLR